MTRAEKSARLRSALARYRGGHFETGSSGGANGMVFFVDAAGRQFFIGGFNRGDAEGIVDALNLVLELLAEDPKKHQLLAKTAGKTNGPRDGGP